ncbi:hypothetical protein Tco_1531736 [Tanacetum coccineum]
MMLEYIENGPLVHPTIEENDAIRPKKYAKFSEQEQLQDDCDVQATNIVLQGLPLDVYSLVNHFQAAKEIWYYLRFAQPINYMHTIGMTIQQVQVNTKFLNALQPEWRKFLTDVKLANNMYTTNFDQLYAYLSQHEGHANEARIMREIYLDPLALVANYQTQPNSVQYPQQLSSIHQTTHSFQPYLSTYEAPHHLQQYQHAYQPQISHPTPSVPQNDYLIRLS